jgi:subtilisin
MPDSPSSISRRQLLRAAGGAAATFGLSGFASAEPGDRVEVNIGYRDVAGRQAAVTAASDVVRSFSFDAITLRLPKRAATALQQDPSIRYVESNGLMYAVDQTLPWGIDRIDSEVAHANEETGAGADIAILDSGIDSDHPDLQANLGTGKAFVECGTGGFFGCYSQGNDNACNEPWDDDYDHGTHCAGVTDAINDTRGVVGVSTEATLHAVKVLDCSGHGYYSDIAAGIEYTAEQSWDVANMSIIGSRSNVVADAVEYAYDRGVLLVAAGGNRGPCMDCVGYPAVEPEVIGVSATNRDDELASFSSTGPEIELAGPGVEIHSTVPGGYGRRTGTSMSCPHVSGAGGLLMANGYTNTEARERLGNTAEDIGLGENEGGNGLVDAAAALGLNSGDN